MAGRHWIGLALIAASIVPTAARAADALVPPPLELVYDMTVGGLTVMHFDLVEHDLGARYRINFSARTEGLANLLFRRAVTSSSEGVLDHGRPTPERYVSDTDASTPRHSIVTFQPGGGLTYTVSPDPADDPDGKLTPLEPKRLVGTTDPLAGLMMLADAATCAGTVPVFDGRHRYDLELSKQADGRIGPDEGTVYAGPVEHCAVHLVRIGGYAVDRTTYITRDDAVMSIARVAPDLPPLPVEIVFEGRWGTFRAHLVAVRSATVTLPAYSSSASSPANRSSRDQQGMSSTAPR